MLLWVLFLGRKSSYYATRRLLLPLISFLFVVIVCCLSAVSWLYRNAASGEELALPKARHVVRDTRDNELAIEAVSLLDLKVVKPSFTNCFPKKDSPTNVIDKNRVPIWLS
jgi:hypothetical protein